MATDTAEPTRIMATADAARYQRTTGDDGGPDPNPEYPGQSTSDTLHGLSSPGAFVVGQLDVFDHSRI